MLYAIATLNGMLPQFKKLIDDMEAKVIRRKEKAEKNKELKINHEAIEAEEKSFKKKILEFLYDGRLIISELENVSNISLDRDKDKYIRYVNKFKKIDNIEEMIEEALDAFYILEDVRRTEQNRDTSRKGDRYRAYPQELVKNYAFDAMFSKINITRKTNAYQHTVGDGEIIKRLKNIDHKTETYGVIGLIGETSNSRPRVRELKTRIDNVALGLPSRITNDAFDIFLAPCFISAQYSDNYRYFAIKKLERELLEDNFKYIRTGGVIVMSIPRFRLTKDVCLMLSKKLYNVTAFKLREEDNNYDICYIIANYEKKTETNKEIYNQFRSYCEPDNLKVLEEVEIPSYQLPYGTVEIKDFKGSIVDEDEILDFVRKDSAVEQILNDQKVEKLSDTTKKPLLPFKVGQLGLVLTSGCLDGLIDEGDGHFHLVKGMVNKQHDATREATGRGEFREDIISSNRVEINAILPNGELKKIT